MTARVYSHTPFTAFARNAVTPQVQLPAGTYSMIVVALAELNIVAPDNTLAHSAVGIGQNQPAQVVIDNMGNNYQRADTLESNSLLLNVNCMQEIWVAFVQTPAPLGVTITVQYPSTTLVAGDVIVLIPANPANQLMLDNSVLTQSNAVGAQPLGSIPINTSQNVTISTTPAQSGELILTLINYIFENQPPTTPPTAPNQSVLGPASLIENVVNSMSYNNANTQNQTQVIGIGLVVASVVLTNPSGITTTFSVGPSGMAYAGLIIGIQEVATPTQSIQENFSYTPFSPEPNGLVSTPFPGLNVIKLPLGT
jgi:hypothetical protein